LLLRDIGAAVGEQGLAVGIDVSPDQLTAARSYCKDMTHVQARVEDIRAVAAADEVFDATVYVQVLEYVPDVEPPVRSVPENAEPEAMTEARAGSLGRERGQAFRSHTPGVIACCPGRRDSPGQRARRGIPRR
jgi:hypothetical protein